MSNQEHYEFERRLEGRCPRCGSGRITFAGMSTFDLEVYGTACLDCGYTDHGDGMPPLTPLFIMPGNPGSHDNLSDYPEVTTQ